MEEFNHYLELRYDDSKSYENNFIELIELT